MISTDLVGTSNHPDQPAGEVDRHPIVANNARTGDVIRIEDDLGCLENDRFPGWYLETADRATERFWNGADWTDLTRPAPLLADFLGPIEPTLLAILSDGGTDLI